MSSITESTSEIESVTHRIFDSMVSNVRVWIGLLVILLVLGGAYALYSSRSDTQADASNSAFFLAQKSLDQEMKALASEQMTPKSANPQSAAKDPKAAQQAQASVESILFTKLDVDAKFPESVKKFQQVSQEYSGTRAGFEAQMALGSLYLNHGDAAKSVSWYEKAVSSAPQRLEKAMALSSLGYAQESAGKLQEALQTYEKALNQGEASLKGDLLMATARTYELLHDTAKARSTYDQILSQLPNSEYSKTAELLKGQLE